MRPQLAFVPRVFSRRSPAPSATDTKTARRHTPLVSRGPAPMHSHWPGGAGNMEAFLGSGEGALRTWSQLLRDRVSPAGSLEAHKSYLRDAIEAWLKLGHVKTHNRRPYNRADLDRRGPVRGARRADSAGRQSHGRPGALRGLRQRVSAQEAGDKARIQLLPQDQVPAPVGRSAGKTVSRSKEISETKKQSEAPIPGHL